MASVNKVILIGNLGKDPEVRHLEGGIAVARFPIATSESYKDKSGEKKEKTEWHNITMWRGLAEVAEKYLRKGQTVYIEGKLQTTSYEKDGEKRYSTEIVATEMRMLTSKTDGSTPAQSSASGNGNFAAGGTNDEPDDLPF